MSGTLFGLSRSQQHDLDGKPLAGWKLYLYAAGTLNPVTAYKNFALTAGQEHPWPIPADANGRLPMFWLADGAYKVRATTSAGTVMFEDDGVPALGASSGGGGGDTTDPNSVASTADIKFNLVGGVLAGWVRLNGNTIGSATSGATERANADTQPLYEKIYNGLDDTLAPVIGGRSGNAAADFAANKQLMLPNWQGRGPMGVIGMGGSPVSRLDNVAFQAGNKNTVGSRGGNARKTLSVSEIPVITPSGVVSVSVSSLGGYPSGFAGVNFGGDFPAFNASQTVTRAITATATFAGTPFGGGQAFDTVSPFMLVTWYVRL